MPTTPLNPHSTICVVKHKGREVGRIAATAPNASAYISELARSYKGCTVDYVEDEDAAMISRMVSSMRF